MSIEKIGHMCISASAGAGKTFQLAHRYIALMARDVPAEKIIALTFSRKAAGEIFDEIARNLWEAASSPAKAKKTASEIGIPGADRNTFLGLLRRLTRDLHKIHVSTLDSFTVGVVRAFPSELGVPGSFQVADEAGYETTGLRNSVLGSVFAGQPAAQHLQTEFLEAFKQATFGSEEKTAHDFIEDFIDNYRILYREIPDSELWGSEKIIWPGKSPLQTSPADLGNAISGMLAELEHMGLNERSCGRWAAFLGDLSDKEAGSTWSPAIDYMFGKLADARDDLEQGTAVLNVERQKLKLTKKQCALAARLMAGTIRHNLASALEQTRGIYRILRQYEELYDAASRSNGIFTFADVQYLLVPDNPSGAGLSISRTTGEGNRLYIDYRLDCALDHWLLDEFQDTSDLQWRMLQNLVDEIVQDPEGNRSFFYVGDVKQTIYRWRGSNPRLFGDVLAKYGKLIEARHLNTSVRCAKPVLDTANVVFGDLSNAGLPAGTVAEWSRIWMKHEPMELGPVPKDGYAALLEPQYDGENKPSVADRALLAAGILKDIDPIMRGLTVAVLVRDNSEGKEIADTLRQNCPPHMTIVHEGSSEIMDNPVVCVLSALVRFAAHPGNTLAWRHVQMSPIAKHIAGEELSRESLPLHLLESIERSGFRETLELWGNRLGIEDDDAFGRRRLADLLTAAAEFDATGSRDCNSFVHFVEGRSISDSAAQSAVRVMTIHQSKGLGFDVVILPDLQKRSIVKALSIGLTAAADRTTHVPRWVLNMPKRRIAEADPVLTGQIGTVDEDACFDELCVLYVAMTRAKHGLYMITSYPGKTSSMISSASLLKTQLAGEPSPEKGESDEYAGTACTRLYHAGNRSWFNDYKAAGSQASQRPARRPLKSDAAKPRRTRLKLIEPSAEERDTRSAARIFMQERKDVLAFGSSIHELFENVEWLDQSDTARIVSEWKARTSASDDIKRNVCLQFQEAISSKQVKEALSRPAGNVTIFTEKQFEVVIGDANLVSGVFDRLVVFRDPSGKPERVTICDYKSDRVEDDAGMRSAMNRYLPQLKLYRQAAARIFQIEESRVKVQLLFTRIGRVVAID